MIFKGALEILNQCDNDVAVRIVDPLDNDGKPIEELEWDTKFCKFPEFLKIVKNATEISCGMISDEWFETCDEYIMLYEGNFEELE